MLYDKSNISKETKHIIDLQNGIKEGLTYDKEMYSATKLLKILSESEYFKEEADFKWPENFKMFLSDSKYI
jgi:hypothetical protein